MLTDSNHSLAGADQKRSELEHMEEAYIRSPGISEKSLEKGEVFSLEDIDPALGAKMHLVNNAIDEIGWTPYLSKLFFLNGFGYAVDSLLLSVTSIVQPQADLEFRPSFKRGLTIAMYVGLFVGALFWGLTADIIGRRFAFNVTLLFGSIFAMIAGAAPNWMSLGFFISASAFGFGGNLILDTTIFLEYLPSGKQWVLTLLAAWWGVGNVIVGLIAWAFMSNYACVDTTTCTKADNMGWRYVCFTSGALVLVMSITRLLVIRLKETPKYLLGQNKDAEVVAVFQWLAHKYNRPCSLTEDQLRACGRIQTSKANSALSIGELKVHIKGLFMTKEMALSTCLIWISWILVGLAFPLYYVFLPEYLKSRGAKFGSDSNYTTWRNYAIVNICGGCAPILAGLICELPRVGRRGTMAFGALAGMAFFFAYTTVRSPAENLGFNCGINFFLNVYYSCLYAYTPEVLPSAHRATGTSISVAFNRIMGMLSAVVATVANTSTDVPIYLCASFFIVLAAVCLALPFEPKGRRSA